MHQPSISVALLNRMLSTSGRPDYQWFAVFRLSAIHLGHAILAIRQARSVANETTQSDIVSRLDRISDELTAITAQCEGETLGSVPPLSRTQDLVRDIIALQREILGLLEKLRQRRDCG
jgi:hypothetical protein